ncbi:MAG: citrate synthase [Brevundimonas sp.]|uniref:citrate/2-methylcitrate synthase n=1 Tax=Brevundimonas sp. TaxID=1871086 RepID=UPI0025BEA172|nr:citrate/2-methylcitrate synthase [Brevundimonas sp.]MBX3478060.1 citrate synthase [Brevundimonas sp.]
MATTQGWIAREEALARLGVKSQTLYAYVSRGRIAARPDPSDSRRSQYALRDIARLIQGEAGPPAVVMRAPARGEADLRSSVSVALDGRLFYRGRDAAQLADHATLEATARILWDAPENPFAGVRPRVDAVGGARPRQRLFAALARRAVEDGSSRGKDASALRGAAASLLNEAVDAVAGPGPRLHFHQRLARGWKVADRDHDLIRRALVLAADTPQGDEVTAARVAAAAGASLAGAALAGMVTLAARPTIQAAETAASAIVQARRNPSAPDIDPAGDLDMGDPVWPGADPRAQALLAAAALPSELEAVRLRAEAGAGRPASLAFALALLGRRLDLPREAVLDLLLVARLSGLLAHAMDQVTDGSPIRSRLRYVGPEPGAN